ncbi:unnamed protein product [Amoebophrya sp. A25]|nr:unnamed protein product [Amoebophrya sp. A25]|eukprot:GSA25T00002639001.1
MRVSPAIANFGRFRRQPTGRLQFVLGKFWNSPQISPINTRSLRVALRCSEHQFLFQRRCFPTPFLSARELLGLDDREHDVPYPGEEYRYKNERCIVLEETILWLIDMVEKEAPGIFEFKRLPRYARCTLLFRRRQSPAQLPVTADEIAGHTLLPKNREQAFETARLEHFNLQAGARNRRDTDHETRMEDKLWSALVVKSARKRQCRGGQFLFHFRTNDPDVGMVLACQPEDKLLVCAPREVRVRSPRNAPSTRCWVFCQDLPLVDSVDSKQSATESLAGALERVRQELKRRSFESWREAVVSEGRYRAHYYRLQALAHLVFYISCNHLFLRTSQQPQTPR